MTIHEHLLNVAGHRACSKARNWAAQYTTAQEVFDNCVRVDWLFWWCARLGQVKQVAKAAKEIADSVNHLHSPAAANAAAAWKKQQDKNMQIARKHLTCPWHEEKDDVTL
jgi:hypothetical protein